MAVSPEEQLIISGAQVHPSEEDVKAIRTCIPEIRDWELLTDTLIRNGTAALVYKNLCPEEMAGIVPAEMLSRLKNAYYQVLGKNMLLIQHFLTLHKSLSDQGIGMIPLKGIYLIEAIYKDIALRPMSDIDLLVTKENAGNCRNILHGLGYHSQEIIKTSFIKQHHEVKHLAPLVMNGVSVEIHTKVLPNDYEYQVDLARYWNNATPATLHGAKVLSLSPEDLLQHLCVHLDQHFNSGKIQFYSFCDIAEVLKYHQHNIDWRTFSEACTRDHCSKNVFSLLYLVHKYFHAPLPDHILAAAAGYATPKTEKLFLLYLQNDVKNIRKEIVHANIKSLSKIKGFRNKIKYLAGDIFPSATFMRTRYHFKYKPMIYWYYLVRIKTGMAGLFAHLLKQFGKKRKDHQTLE